MSFSFVKRTPAYKPFLAWFCLFALVWITLLLFAGGWTTSIDAGMAFLDWPLSNGSLNPDGWTEDSSMLAEHSHRLLGAILGTLSLILVFWTQLREERPWVRHLALALLILVVLQGLLGGARVLFDEQNHPDAENNALAQTFAILHALGAMLTLIVLVSLTTAVSRWWIERNVGLKGDASIATQRYGLLLCFLILLQVVLGATIRHQGVGLAIDNFPYATSSGSWLPDIWNWAVVLNFLHRAGAIVLTVVAILFFVSIWRHPTTRHAFGRLALIPLILIVLQIIIGGTVIWSDIHPHTATMHHLIGALLLGVTWLVAFASFRRPVELLLG